MLEKMPRALGHALEGVRAGHEKLVSRSDAFAAAPETLKLTSSAFENCAELPARFTEDGAKVSPPLAWTGVPAGAASLVLIVEDPDAPTPQPLVHCIAWELSASEGGLAEGELNHDGHDGGQHELGRNSFFKTEWLAPDPPTGHGLHDYVFQLFALDTRLQLDEAPGRSKVVEAMEGHVLAKGVLIGAYERR